MAWSKRIECRSAELMRGVCITQIAGILDLGGLAVGLRGGMGRWVGRDAEMRYACQSESAQRARCLAWLA